MTAQSVNTSTRAGSPWAALAWRKSSYSNHEAACVELAVSGPSATAVRDSKRPDGPVLVFSEEVAAAFVSAVAAETL